MRLSNWVIGIIGFVALFAFTGVCALVSYGSTRGVLIDLWDSGIRVESPGDVAQALLNPDAVQAAATPTPNTIQDNNGMVVIPSPTPLATVSTVQNASDADATPLPTANVTGDPVGALGGAETSSDDTTDYTWDSPFALNILLMGIDQRDEAVDQERAHRTDTMIVLHVDPVRETAAMISFPRDLWVDIPNYSTDRINRANYIGDLNAYPGGGGPALAMETIRANFGVDVDYFVMVNFTVFERVISLIAPDGVEVCVDEYILDEKYPDDGFGTITVEFEVGCQNLDGTRLLQYARTRRTANSDIDRARRQQQVLFAIREHVVSSGGVQSIISQAVPLWNELSGSYRTNLSLNELRQLASLVDAISADDIQTAVLGPPDYSEPATNIEGDQILIPYKGRINQLIQQLFYGSTADGTLDYRSLAEDEAAEIRVYNGTNTSGLADRTRLWLTSKNVQVDTIGNAQETVENTVIVNYGGGRNTAQWLAEVMGLPQSRVQSGSDGLVSGGVVVIVGNDVESIIGGE